MENCVQEASEKLSDLSTNSSAAEATSKNALKKEMRRKQKEEERRIKEEEKKNKAAAMANLQSKKPSAAEDEDMDPTQYYENRLKALASLKASGVNPYPHKYGIGISIEGYIEKYRTLEDGERLADAEILAGIYAVS